MIITLIKSTQMFSLTLPQRVKGQYWLTDLDEKGRLRQLASIEAIDEKWFLKENKMVKIFDTEGNVLKNHILTPSSFLYLKIENSDERVILFAENIDYTRQTLTRIVAKEPAVFTIGRDPNNNFCFNNRFVSNEHARLMFDGEAWSICDLASKNGTYVNGYRIETKKLKPGDFIYIMGLKMVVGSNYIALNNPDEKLKIKSDSIGIGRTQVARNSDENIPEQPEKQFFSRSPRFRKEIEHAAVRKRRDSSACIDDRTVHYNGNDICKYGTDISHQRNKRGQYGVRNSDAAHVGQYAAWNGTLAAPDKET